MSKTSSTVGTPSTSTKSSASTAQPMIADVTTVQKGGSQAYVPPITVETAPTVPAGTVFLTGAQRRALKHLTRDQLTSLPALMTELAGASTYSTDFGSHAPSAALLGLLAKGTVALNQQLKPSQTWAQYIGDQFKLCGDALMTNFEVLESMFNAAVAVNPALANSYPVLAAFIESGSVIANKAAATRKAKKKAKAKAASAAAASTAAAPAASSAPAANPAATVVAAPAAAGH